MSWRAEAAFRKLIVALVVAATGLTAASVRAALPTIAEIEAIDLANRNALSELHVQVRQSFEPTEAAAESERVRANRFDRARRSISKTSVGETQVEIDGKLLTGAAAVKAIEGYGLQDRGKAKWLEQLTRIGPQFLGSAMEVFLRGSEYQVRMPLRNFTSAEDLLAWQFSTKPVTAETLVSHYDGMTLFSHSPDNSPPSRMWGPILDSPALVTRRHVTEVKHAFWPPYVALPNPTEPPAPRVGRFLGHPNARYEVLGQVVEEGRRLTIVDVAFRSETGDQFNRSRGWIDLERGAIPVRIWETSDTKEIPADWDRHRQPSRVTAVEGIRSLANGAFFPDRIAYESWQPTEHRRLTEAEMNDYRAGRLKIPLKVFYRIRYEFPVVEVPAEWPAGFFALPFPKNQEVFDADEQKTIGEIPLSPLVQIGQHAPPLTVGRWLDGKARTLADLRGQVVVLDFWTSRDTSMSGMARTYRDIQKRFAGQPVTFVSLCMAERDPDETERKIAALMKETGWTPLAAIDAGWTIRNSATMRAYGIEDPSFRVIIGPDGRIADVDSPSLAEDPDEELGELDEDDPIALAAFEKKTEDWVRSQFEAAEEPYPPPANITEEQLAAIYERVATRSRERRIEKILKAAAAE